MCAISIHIIDIKAGWRMWLGPKNKKTCFCILWSLTYMIERRAPVGMTERGLWDRLSFLLTIFSQNRLKHGDWVEGVEGTHACGEDGHTDSR